MDALYGKLNNTVGIKYNYTVTFDPKRITLSETWKMNLNNIYNIIDSALQSDVERKGFLVREPHKNKRAHLHGQLVFKRPLSYSQRGRINTELRKAFGKSNLILNDDSEEHYGNRDWLEYCIKELTPYKMLTHYEDVGY